MSSSSWLRLAPLALAVTWTAAAHAGVPVHGRALAQSRALPNATVRLFEHVPDFERDLACAEGRILTAPVAETVTDSRGRFRLDAPGVGMWTVRVEADGRLPAEMVLRPLLDAVVLPDAELEEEAWLDVWVRGPGGEGIAGARILATRPEGKLRRRLPAEDLTWRTPRTVAQADDEGHARVLRPPDMTVFLEATAPGFASATLQVRGASDPAVRMDLESGRPRVLRGLDLEGRAVPDALTFQENGLLPLGRTDAEGHVTVFQGETELRLVLRDREARRGDLRLLPPGPGKGPPSETPVVLQPSPVFSGRVVDRSGRRPLPGAVVWTAASFTRSAGDGTFRLPLSARGPQEILVAAPGYATERLRSATSHETTVALRPAAVVAGRVVDESGRPRDDVEITVMERFETRSALSLRNRRPEPFRVSRTLPGGGFRISGLAARTPWHLTFRAEGFTPQERTLDDLAPFEERIGLEIVLRRGCRGFGHVHDEDGEPLAGATVRLTPELPPPPERVPGRATYTFEGLGPEPPESLTDRQGRFELRDLGPGSYVLDATADGFVPGRLPAAEVPEECADVDFGTLVLRRGAAIAGRAVDAAGQAVAGAEVRVTTDTFVPEPYLPLYLGSESVRTRTEADGSFRVSALGRGEPHHLLLTKDGLAPGVALGVTAPQDGLEVLLPPAARISGRVTDGDGRPVPGAALRLTPDVQGFAMSVDAAPYRTDGQGAFEISDVAPGRWTLWASAPGFQTHRRNALELEPAAEIRDLEVVLAEGAELAGRVLAPDGSPAVGALVGLRPGPDVFTDGDGRYSFTGLAPGGVAQLTAQHDDYPQVTREVRVETGRTTLDLRFDGGVPVSGIVLGPASEPVSGAQVVLVRDSYGATVPSTRSTEDGSFTLPGVPPGRYQARVSKEGYAVSWSRETTEVGGDAVTDLDLRLSAGGVVEGQIRGLGREELARAEVVASNPMATVRARLDGEGGYRIAPLAPGSWTVKATVESRGRSLFERIVLEADRATATLDFDFGIGATLTGTVQVDGQPAAGLAVYVQETEGAFSSEVRTGTGGSFAVRDLAPGTYRLVVTTERGFRHVETLGIDGDRHVNVEVFGVRVAGRVVDALTGEPVAEASVSLGPLDEETPAGGHTRTDSTGGFRIEDVPEGSWALVVRRDGYVVHERRIEVRGPLEGLEVELTPDG